ncbi:MAG: ABC transporter substrate-binding protein [Gemmatimonadales bacterium]|jgi:branched-chain amino acid transport system substrate-binding protein|nr:ABC transporter substrate-binding protein [Gemmatimonadales bacterium]
MSIRALLRGLALLATLRLASACGASGEPIRLGLAGAFSEPIGEPMRRAARLAVDEINARGGIGGRPLALVERDDHASPDSAVRIAAELYGSDVVAVVGHLFSGTTLAAAPIYNTGADPVVAISPSSSAPEVSGAGPYTFRLCPSDLEHGVALARWMTERLDLRGGAVFYLNDAYGRGVRRAFATQFAQRGGRLVALEPYLGSAPDVGAQLDRLARVATPDFLFVAGNRSEAETILRGARARGLTMPLAGGDGLEGIEAAGPLADGSYVSAAYHPSINTQANRTFVSAYARRYPDAPVPNQPAAATYDAVHLLAGLLAETGPSRAALRRALADVGAARRPYEGVTGRIAFDSLGDVTGRPVYITVVRDGTALLAGGL